METEAIFSEEDFHCFQGLVYHRFLPLSFDPSYTFLSLPWIARLLDAFFECQDEFSDILSNYRANVSIPPLVSSITTDFLTTCIKSLNICNNSRKALHKIRMCQDPIKNLMEAVNLQQLLATRNALQEMLLLFRDDSVPSHNPFFSGAGSSRSWSQPDPCSAAEQLESIATSQVQPRGGTGSNSAERLAATIFTMGFLLMFVMWILVVALPCQDRTTESLFTIPSQFCWAKVLNIIQGRIIDESNKDERRNSKGLMMEMGEMEKSIGLITYSMNSENWPVGVEKRWMVSDRVYELLKFQQDCSMEELDTVEQRLRVLFSSIWTCLTQGFQWLTFQSNLSS